MSYILDALRKSEQQRQREAAPSLHAPQMAIYYQKPKSLLFYGVLVVGLVLLGLLLSYFHPWQHEKETTVVANAANSLNELKPTTIVTPQVAPTQKYEQQLPVKKPVIKELEKPAPLKQKPVEARKKPVEASQSQLPPQESEAPRSVEKSTQALPQPVNKPVADVPIETAQPAENPQPHKIMDVSELPPSIAQEMPKMAIAGIAYSTTAKESSVGINDRLLQEGDYLAPGLKLERINANSLVFSYKGYLIRQGL